jgi:hypothetical protein
MSEPLAPARSAGVAARSIAVAMTLGMVVAACGSLAVPRVSVAPVVTRAPTAAASASPSTHAAAIAAFVESVTSKELTYRIEYTGELRMSTRIVKVKGAMTVVGEDFAASWRYDFHDVPSYDVQVRGVKGKGYIKRDAKAWASIKNFDAADSYVPFKRVTDTSDVKYLGSVDVDGKTLHRIAIPEALLMHPTTIPYAVKKEKVEALVLEVRIDDKGVPRTGTWELRSQARIGEGVGQLQRVVYELKLKFSKVGAKLTVKKP